jgi:hypothetical protein
MNRVDYTSYQGLEVLDRDENYHEVIFAIDVRMTSPGREAYISGPPENCYPAESAEFEIVQIGVDSKEVNTVWTEKEFSFFLGDVADKLLEAAILDAEENFVNEPDYEDQYDRGDF